MKDAKAEIDLKPYLAAMTAMDNRKRAAAVAYAKVELPMVTLAALAERVTERYRRTSSRAVREAAGASLSELGRLAVRPVLRAVHRSRRDAVRLHLVLLLCELKPAISILEQFDIADLIATVARTTRSETLKAACGFARTVLTGDEFL